MTFRTRSILLAVTAAALLLAFFGRLSGPDPVTRSPETLTATHPESSSPTRAPVPEPAEVRPAAATELNPMVDDATRQRIYRLQLDQGVCTLDRTVDVTGDFGPPRRQVWQAGMLACRLRDSAGTLLAEQTLPAPDFTCVVLDSNNPSGDPSPARLTPEGPVTFQVRLPLRPAATHLEILRIGEDASSQPTAQLVANLPLASE